MTEFFYAVYGNNVQELEDAAKAVLIDLIGPEALSEWKTDLLVNRVDPGVSFESWRAEVHAYPWRSAPRIPTSRK